MRSLCRLPVAKNHNFWANFGQILTFWGLLYRPPLTDEGQIWCDRADQRSTLTGQISSESVHCFGFRWPKTTILDKFWHFLGLLYRPPFTDDGQIWYAIADPRSTLTCQISSRSVRFFDFYKMAAVRHLEFLVFQSFTKGIWWSLSLCKIWLDSTK